jgi:hypothetical protein
MDITKCCPIRADRRNGYVLVYKKNNAVETWYHVANLKKLIKFLKHLNKTEAKFELYKCSSCQKMDEQTLSKIMNIGYFEREKLILDDN